MTPTDNRKIVTVGVYGFTETDFFQALKAADVDTFCDIRFRRGMRGSTYAFVNSRYLQERLRELGIRYLHIKALAPSPATREEQHSEDRSLKQTKRQRTTLSRQFVETYRRECLTAFDSTKFITELGPANVVCLFCVERAPEACHRSIVAERLTTDLGLEVNHLKP